MAHTRYSCTAPTGNRVMALFYFHIYIVDGTFRVDAYLGNGFYYPPAEDFEGVIVLALSVHPSSFHP